jgi:hypothetical protein
MGRILTSGNRDWSPLRIGHSTSTIRGRCGGDGDEGVTDEYLDGRTKAGIRDHG